MSDTPQRSNKEYSSGFTLGVKFDPSSDGMIAINSIRKKYAAKFGHSFHPYTGIKLSEIPTRHLDFCQDVLTEFTAKHPIIVLELGSPFFVSRGPPPRYINYPPRVRWDILNIDELVTAVRQLEDKLSPTIENMNSAATKLAMGDGTLGRKHFLKTQEEEPSLKKATAASVRLFGTPGFGFDVRDALEALSYIESEYGNKSLSIKTVGFHLWMGEREILSDDPKWHRQYRDFPFRAS
jgi:hypothetical protein